MQTLPIVKDLDELKDRGLGFVPSLEGLLMDEFVFQRAEEAVDHRVVVTGKPDCLIAHV